jgi:hypothetical protein
MNTRAISWCVFSAALVASACGGKVVFDGLPGEGSGGATSSSSVSSSSAMACAPMPFDGETIVHVCAGDFSEPCPDVNDPTLFNVLSQQIGGGCGAEGLDSIACGPTPNADGCCYDVLESLMGCF